MSIDIKVLGTSYSCRYSLPQDSLGILNVAYSTIEQKVFIVAQIQRIVKELEFSKGISDSCKTLHEDVPRNLSDTTPQKFEMCFEIDSKIYQTVLERLGIISTKHEEEMKRDFKKNRKI